MVHSCVTREPLTVVAWGSPRVGEEANTPGLSAMGPFFQIRELWLWEPRPIEYGGTLVGAGSCLTEELCVPLCQVPPAASPLPHLSDRRQDVGIASRRNCQSACVRGLELSSWASLLLLATALLPQSTRVLCLPPSQSPSAAWDCSVPWALGASLASAVGWAVW